MANSKFKTVAVTLGAVALSLMVINSAVGGPSLRSLVKKEVKKQIKPGPAGPQGAQGAQGPAGPNAVTVVRNTIPVDVGPDTSSGQADCPSGMRATGGGAAWAGGADSDSDFVLDSGPLDAGGTFVGTVTGDVPVSWYATVFQDEFQVADTAYVYAICQ